MIKIAILTLMFAAVDPNSVEGLKAQLRDRDNQIAALRAEVAALKALLADSNGDPAELNGAGDSPQDLAKARDVARMQLRKAEEEYTRLQTKLEAVKSTSESLSEQVQSTKSISLQQQQRLTALNTEIKNLTIRTANAKIAVERAKERLTLREEQVAAAQSPTPQN